MLFATLAALVALFVFCAVLSEERFRSAVLLAFAAFVTFVAVDSRLDDLEKRTALVIEAVENEAQPIVWMETEIDANDSIFGLCLQAASGTDIRPCTMMFWYLNRDKFPTESVTERDLWLDEDQSYIIPIRLDRSE